MAEEFTRAFDLTKVDDSDIMTQPFSLSDTDPIVSQNKSNVMTGEEFSKLGKISSSWNDPEWKKTSASEVFGTEKVDLTKPEEFIASTSQGFIDEIANFPDKAKNTIAQIVMEGYQDKNKLAQRLVGYLSKITPQLPIGVNTEDVVKKVVEKSDVFKPKYDEKLVNTLDGREYPLVEWARKTLATTTKAIQDRDLARAIQAEQRGIDREAWSNEIGRTIGAMVPVIALGKGVGATAKALGASADAATTIGGAAMKAGTMAQMATDYGYTTAAQYVEKTGDKDFTNFTPEDAKGLSALGYGAIGTMIEYGFGGVEPLFANGMEKLGTSNILKAVGKTMVGEAWEEFLQEWEEFLFRTADGTNTRTWGETLKDSLKSAVYGGLIGGAIGDVSYRTNRRNIANALMQTGMDYNTAVKIADTVIEDTGAEIFKRADENVSLMNQVGESYNKLKAGVRTALETVGWSETMLDPTTQQPMDIDSYSDVMARNISSQVIRQASVSGLSPNEFMDLSSFQVIDNVVYLKPLGNVKAQLDEQNAIIKRQLELKKTGASDNNKLSNARMRKNILQKAYNIQEYKKKQAKEQIKRQTTPELAKEIETATKDAEVVKELPTQADFGSKVESENLTSAEKSRRYGNAVLKRLLPSKSDFDAVMVDPMYANAKQAIIAVADRINSFIKAHRTYSLKTDIANALKKMQTVNQGNFIDSVTTPALDGQDVIAENAFLYHFLFSDATTIQTYLDSYITRAEDSLNQKKGNLSKKDLVGQSFKATNNAMQTQAQVIGAEYASIYNEDGSYADKNVMAVMLSYQNQFISESPRVPFAEYKTNIELYDKQIQPISDKILNNAKKLTDTGYIFDKELDKKQKQVQDLLKDVDSDILINSVFGKYDVNPVLLNWLDNNPKIKYLDDVKGEKEKSWYSIDKTQWGSPEDWRVGDVFLHAIPAQNNTEFENDFNEGNIETYVYNIPTTTDELINNLFDYYVARYNEDLETNENMEGKPLESDGIYSVKQEQPLLFQEQFDLANKNARLDDIYPEYTGETIRIIDPAELKQAQYEVIQRTNPMQDEYHVGIRSVNDIKTFDETIDDKDSFVWGDYSQEDAKRDLAKNEITIYSSKPIENGVFVSTSYRQAQEYAGGKGAKVYKKTVPLDYVAWISGDEGQFAITDVVGKKRSVYNSNGERIAQSEPALRNFYKWFGDSKVVDKKGRPLVMHHGTKTEFEEFYRSSDIGFHFGSKGAARIKAGRGKQAVVYNVYLKIQNPLKFDRDLGNWDAAKDSYLATELLNMGIITQEQFNGLRYNFGSYGSSNAILLRNALKEKGFDGIEYPNYYEDTGKISYIAFEPTQIKSVNNRGTYSADTGNIYYQANIKDLFKPIGSQLSKFRDKVRDVFQGKANIRSRITVLDETPVVYQSLGFDKKPLSISYGVISKINKDKHVIPTDIVEDLPELVSDPVAVFKSKTDPENSVVAVLDAKDTDERTVVSIIRKTDGSYNVIPSVYGKDNFENFVANNVKDGNLIYMDENKVAAIRPFSLQLLGVYNDNLSKNNYITKKDVVNQNIKPLEQGKKANGFYDPELGVIVLGRNMNEMTLPHEMQHYWLDKIFSIYKRAKAGELKVRDEWMTETKELFDMLGIDENQTQLTEGQQEKFARMSEAYLTGMGVSGDMNATFKEYQHWIPEKYKSMMNLAYKDDNGKIVLPYLDQAAVDFFNKWYANYSLPSLATSPERQEFINPEDENGEVLPVSIKEMNNRDKEFGVDAEEQVKTDQRLYNTLDENMPAEIKIESDGQKVVQESRSNFLKESEKQQRRWFERKSRDTEAQLAQDYIEKNPEHAKEVVYGDPELVPNDTGIDRATLINAYMALNKITPESEDWATLQTNIAINQSLAGTQLALSNNTSYRTYLDALREIENAREMKVATNYAGAKQGAVERFNRDIQRFVDQELPKVLATAPNSQAREIALKSLFEMARTKFSGNTTGGFLNQMDLDFAKAQKGASAAFTRWAINQIKKDAGAKLNNQEQAKLLEISAKAQQAVTDLDDRNIGKAVAGAVAIREWQVEKDKLSGVSPEKFSLFGDWAPRAMLASFNTLVVSNIPSTAMNTLVVRMLESGVFGENNVSKSLTDSEIKRIKAIYGASAMNLAQMEKPTSPSLLHGEKYSSSGQKWYDPFTILGKEDNWFRVPTFVNTLARIATQDAKTTGRDADEVFKEYCRLENQSDEAKLARKQALAVSNMAVFTQDGALARSLNEIRSWINKGSRALIGLDPNGFGLGNLLSPFLKTGANIAEMGIRGSIAPITTISALVQSWRSGKAIDPMKKLALKMDWTYFALSSLAVALLSALTSDDDEFYTDPYETGKAYDPNKPYDSINIAGVWIDLDFFGVFAIPIRTGCKLVKQWKTDNLSAIYKGYGQGLKYAAMDTPLLESVFNNQISYATKKTEDWATGYAYTQANKLVPSQIKPLSRVISRGTGTELDISGAGKVLERKFHRNYGFDGAELTTQDLIDIFTTKITYQE